ncbi:hypothetical protein H8356DRAFT_1089870 [Neocallimastix lanati (nom. inval.)]|nr:hypothetical protein H8356DRAFT_1089913 [Neocallimastix sp. JGI-2020a]KAG4082999.1 hypothetical protein H8356DRAFT_1089870 [Neocallimastix sp. JGI-2020a]
MMPYVIIINFENENTYTLIFHIYYDIINNLNIEAFDDTNTDNFNFQLYLNYIRYQSVIQSIIDKTLIYLHNNNVNINYFSRIMDTTEKREKNYASSTEACLSFFILFYFFILNIYTILAIIFVKIKTIFPTVHLVVLYLIFFFYGFSNCFLAFYFSIIINKSFKRTITIVLFFLLLAISYLGYSYIENYKLITNIAGLFFPPLAYVNIMKDLISKNKKCYSINLSDVIKEETIRNGLLILILSCLIYFTLSISAEGYSKKIQRIKYKIFNSLKKRNTEYNRKLEEEKRNRNSIKSFIEPDPINKKKIF